MSGLTYVRYDISSGSGVTSRVKPLVMLSSITKPPFSKDGARRAGYFLWMLQRGERLRMPHSRPMRSMGRGCHELRIHDSQTDWRIVYYVDADAVVVLDVFDKQSRATPKRAIERCRRRLRDYKNLT